MLPVSTIIQKLEVAQEMALKLCPGATLVVLVVLERATGGVIGTTSLAVVATVTIPALLVAVTSARRIFP